MTDPNAELAAHAERLRGLAEAATPGEWAVDEIGAVWRRTVPISQQSTDEDAALIAALGPGFARKTADQWDGIARRHIQRRPSCGADWTPDGCPDLADALAVARTLTPADEREA